LDLPLYKDRAHAGRFLAELLRPRIDPGSIVLAIPNGGVAVGVPVALDLKLPLGLLIVRKIQLPWNTEAGFGAVGSDESVLLNEPMIRGLDLTESQVQAQTEKALKSVRERLEIYGPDAIPPELKGHTVVLVDDGLASGMTMQTALELVKRRRPGRTIVAVPTCSRSAFHRIKPLTDELISPHIGTLPVFAVAEAYENWRDLTDEEARRLLDTLKAP